MQSKKKEIYQCQLDDNLSKKHLIIIKDAKKENVLTIEDKIYNQQPLVQSSDRKNIYKFNNVNSKFHSFMKNGIELGPNKLNNQLQHQFNSEIIQAQQYPLSQRLNKKEQETVNNIFFTDKNQFQKIRLQDQMDNENNIQKEEEGVQLENNQNKKLINLNNYGQMKMNELVSLAKSCAISDNKNSINSILRNKNNYLMGQSVRNITYLARKKDNNQLKNIKSYSLKKLNQEFNDKNKLDNSNVKNKGQLRHQKLFQHIVKKFEKQNEKDLNESSIITGEKYTSNYQSCTQKFRQ